VKSGDPVEQEKQLKYASLVANTIMLSNVADGSLGRARFLSATPTMTRSVGRAAAALVMDFRAGKVFREHSSLRHFQRSERSSTIVWTPWIGRS
jgi:hypothetical protein